MKWRQIEPGRLIEDTQGLGPRWQIVFKGKRWQVLRQSWAPSQALYVAPLKIGMADSLAQAKKMAECHAGSLRERQTPD